MSNVELEKIQKQLASLQGTLPKDQKNLTDPAVASDSVQELLTRGKAIYGPDSREETVTADRSLKLLSSSVCVLVEKEKLKVVNDSVLWT